MCFSHGTLLERSEARVGESRVSPFDNRFLSFKLTLAPGVETNCSAGD